MRTQWLERGRRNLRAEPVEGVFRTSPHPRHLPQRALAACQPPALLQDQICLAIVLLDALTHLSPERGIIEREQSREVRCAEHLCQQLWHVLRGAEPKRARYRCETHDAPRQRLLGCVPNTE